MKTCIFWGYSSRCVKVAATNAPDPPMCEVDSDTRTSAEINTQLGKDCYKCGAKNLSKTLPGYPVKCSGCLTGER